MLKYVVEYEVIPGENLPEGLPRQRLVVLSPVWRGPVLYLEYPDGEVEILVGRGGGNQPCDVQVFWTRKDPEGPPVCLAIGGQAGLRLWSEGESKGTSRGLAFLALAESVIPAEVLAVIGPPPSADSRLLG
jgi:hypothetical protein